MNRPITVAPTCHRAARASTASGSAQASTMRSWASDSHTSHGARPGYLRGTRARSTSAPSFSAISPTAEDRPPAPQSVMAW